MFILTTNIEIFQKFLINLDTKIILGHVRGVLKDRISVDWSNSSIGALTEADMSCLGLIYEVGQSRLADQVEAWWRERSGENLARLGVDIADEPARLEAAVSTFICQRLIHLNTVISAENTNLWAQASSLRRSYDTLQGAFSRLETAIHSLRMSDPALVYEADRPETFWAPSDGLMALEQRLPCLSTAFSLFELYFDPGTKRETGHLTVSLRLEPAGSALFSWTIKYADVLSGWNSFTPPPIVDEPSELVVALSWSEPHGAPKIGLSKAHHNSLYGAVDGGESGRYAMLALRLWAGLPGVRSPAPITSPKSTDAPQPKRLSVTLKDLQAAKQYVMADTILRDYPSVDVNEEHSGLLVHPHSATVPTLAILDMPIPAGTTFISALCKTVLPTAPSIYYALALLPPGLDPDVVFDFGRPDFNVSDWLCVTASQTKKLHLLLDAPAQGDERLCFATRLAPDASEAAAWAIFSAVDLGWGWTPRFDPVRPLSAGGDIKLQPAEATRQNGHMESSF
jgi:hypothetical protein